MPATTTQAERSRAQDEIEHNLAAGAVAEYLDGDTALEMLGDILKIFRSRGEPGEGLQEQLRRIDTAVGSYLEAACDRIVDENIDFVMQANALDPRRALLPNVLAFNGTGVVA